MVLVSSFTLLVSASKSPFSIMSFGNSLDPIPTQVTPALNQFSRFSRVVSTPPVGMMLVHGHGPLTPLTNEAPPTSEAGNIFTNSAPNSSAFPISDTEPQPGAHRIFRRLHI